MITAIRAAGFEPRSQDPQALFECAEFIVHFHAQRLKNLRGRMMTSVTTDELSRSLAPAAESRETATLFRIFTIRLAMRRAAGSSPKFAKHPGQFLFAVTVYDRSGSQLLPRIHPHVERTIAHDS